METKEKKISVVFVKELVIYLILFMIAFLICLQSPLNIFAGGHSGTDSSVFRYIALSISKGEVPYKDTFDHKGLLIYFFNYLGMKINSDWGIWIIEILSLMIACIFLYKTARLFSECIIAVLCVGISISAMGEFFQGGNYTEEFALPFMAISLYFFNEYIMKNFLDVRKVFICGICLAQVFWLRANMIGVWCAFIFVILVKEVCNKEWIRAGKEVVFFVAGIIIGVMPYFFYLIKHKAVADFWSDYIIFNLKYSKYGYTGSGHIMAERMNAVLFFLESKVTLLVVIALIIIFAGMIMEKETEKKNWLLLYSNALCFIISLFLACISGKYYGHYGMMLIPTYVYPINSLLKKIMKKRNIICSAILASCVIYIIFINSKVISKNICAKLQSEVSEKNKQVVEVIKQYTDDDDKISVFGNNDYIYIKSGRLSASKYSYQLPIISVDEKIYEEYKAEIGNNLPIVIVIMKEHECLDDFILYIKSLNYVELEKNIYISCKY